MSSSLPSQAITAQLFEKRPRRVIAAFGLHPWFSHHVSFEPDEGYERLFPSLDQHDADNWPKQNLPPRMYFGAFMDQLRQHLISTPSSILGEVGLDKAFRLTARNAKGETRRTKLMVPMEHQRKVLDAQLDLAVELRKNISLHAVQCTAETIEVIEGLERRWGERLTGPKLISGRKARREVERAKAGDEGRQTEKQETEKGIKIDWHSAFVSVETLQSVVKKFPEIMYFSYAFTLFEDKNLNKLDQLIKHTPDDRLLIESDWGSDPSFIDGKLEQMMARVMAVKGWEVEKGIEQLEANWLTFSGSVSP
ncbi:hypothetical protein CROQUDRAFT_661519 [Cronartium quercuum f. sp. fusiforme G11]|uniref:Metallo-dependent hydrolase n=1 Tax=Cronartium quercuum f. sp. fusiforme G11 TaxID=708437 RepID=A0A9P6NC97_9BASI|nr:hypothetical protein CROQUDRAFT_661519 [Cronartium quercuum f. sp. fusiforme G11]